MKTLIKYLPWIIALIFAVIVIFMIAFKKDPPQQVTIDHEAQRKLKENELSDKRWAKKYDALKQKVIRDSIKYWKGDSISQRKIKRLTYKLNSINTTTATASELDSLINDLYP